MKIPQVDKLFIKFFYPDFIIKFIMLGIIQFFILESGFAQSFTVTDGDQLFSIDVASCALNPITKISTSKKINDLTYAPNGNLYGLAADGTLYLINQTNGSVRFITKFENNQNFNSLVCSGEGIIYATGVYGTIFAYNLADNQVQVLGNVGVGAAGDLTFYEGQLFMAALDSTMVAVNLENVSLSRPVIQMNADIRGIVTFADNCNQVKTYATTGGSNAIIYEIDLASSMLNQICQIPTQIRGAASLQEFKASTVLTLDAVIPNDTRCGQNNGSIEVQATLEGSNSAIIYSIDGENFQEEAVFDSLAPGIYPVTVQDEDGCFTKGDTVEIAPSNAIALEDVLTEENTCGLKNSEITALATGGTGNLVYSLNDEKAQDGNNFSNLGAGEYTITVIDGEGCLVSTPMITFQENFALAIDNIEQLPPTCGKNNGGLVVTKNGGNGQVLYQMNGDGFTENPEFSNLPGGDYIVTIQDEAGCADTSDVIALSPSQQIIIDQIIAVDTICREEKNSILVEASGGDGFLKFSLNNGRFQNSSSFNNLENGIYSITIQDQNECTVMADSIVLDKDCPIDVHIPTAFSPNEDGLNDFFQIFTEENLHIIAFSIFNRWGNLIYHKTDFYADDLDSFWDGQYKGSEAETGVYNYKLVVESRENQMKTIDGTVTLVR